MNRTIIILILSLGLFSAAAAQAVDCIKGNASLGTFDLKGVVTGSTAPMTVIVFPLNAADSKPMLRYYYGDAILARQTNPNYVWIARHDGPMVMNNPEKITDAKGVFTMKVPKELFLNPCGCRSCKPFKLNELAIGLFVAAGKGRWESNHELLTVKFDSAATATDAGKLAFKAAKH